MLLNCCGYTRPQNKRNSVLKSESWFTILILENVLSAQEKHATVSKAHVRKQAVSSRNEASVYHVFKLEQMLPKYATDTALLTVMIMLYNNRYRTILERHSLPRVKSREIGLF